MGTCDHPIRQLERWEDLLAFRFSQKVVNCVVCFGFHYGRSAQEARSLVETIHTKEAARMR
jgi:hypothetical protein